MTRIRARLDPPSEQSFGVSPLVVERDGRLEVTGLSSASSQRASDVSEEKLQGLIAAGHAARANLSTRFGPGTALVGLWIGKGFASLTTELGISVPPLAVDHKTVEPGGEWGVTTATDAWQYLNRWMISAFARFSEANEKERAQIATAMRWALPLDLRTVAATWSTAKDPARELEWQRRVAPAGSNPGFEQALRAQLAAPLQTRDPLHGVRFLAFSGGSGTQRDELVRALAAARGWGLVSFRDAIECRLGVEKTHDKKELMRLGQILVETAAMSLAVDVIARAALEARAIVALDSIRHLRVLELLQWLAPHRLKHVAITAKKEDRIARLKSRSLNPQEIFEHPTELELASLEQKADARFEDDVDLIALDNQLAALTA